MPNSSGLMNRRDAIAKTDATVVALQKGAGAIPLGITNCSELCMWYESSNKIYGWSNNPYDLQHIYFVFLVGGEAACSVIGVGSDIGGSIRMPAFFNGIFGHKPSPGVVPNKGQFPLAVGAQELFLSTGPICHYAEDLAPMLKVMAGPGIKRLKLDTKVHLKDLKCYWMEHDGGSFLMSKVDQDLIMTQKKVILNKICLGIIFSQRDILLSPLLHLLPNISVSAYGIKVFRTCWKFWSGKSGRRRK
uniref:Amidase domain-containing protein n=1 Tax=Pan troglodytes TaxID=9598 RepID=A0A2I3T4W6_PANTR